MFENRCIFVIKDLRPFKAIEGEGMMDLLKVMVHLGSKYPWMTDDDIEDLIPCRKTIRNDVQLKTDEAKSMIQFTRILCLDKSC